MNEACWRDPRWLDVVLGWIDDRLGERGITRTGSAEQPHVYPWATALRVPTDHGDMWFKATTDALRHEAALTERIAARRRDAVPTLLATDTAAGWMLMTDAGQSLRIVVARERSLDRWLRVLPLYADIQLDTAADVQEMLALGVPDMRLAVLPKAYLRLMDEIGADRRLRDAAGLVAELCDQLAGYGLPQMLQHDDLHDGQVYLRGGVYTVLDWGDACISHPFFTMSVTLQGVLSWGLDDVADSVDTTPFRDAYLAPFAKRLGREPDSLVEAATTATRLGWACRAVNGHVPGDNERTLTRLRMFLDGKP